MSYFSCDENYLITWLLGKYIVECQYSFCKKKKRLLTNLNNLFYNS